MKKLWLCWILFFYFDIYAQNIVPNPSFETHTNCPSQISGVNLPDYVKFATPWYLPTEGSSDYFNACNTLTVGVPNNIMGNQSARTGNAYVGLILRGQNSGNPNRREYIQVPLLSSMDTSKSYCISFYVSLAEIAFRSIDNIGMYFSVGPYIDISGTSFKVLPFTPQVKNVPGNFLSSKTDWMEVSAIYKPDKAYTHITIGNFDNDANTAFIQLYDPNPTDVYMETSYYFIDDVTVFEQTINVDTIQYICPNLRTNIKLNGNYTNADIKWYDFASNLIGIGDNIYLTTNSETKIKVVVSYAGCYTDNKTITLKLYPPVELNLGNDTIICKEDSIPLYANHVYTAYQWSTGQNTSNIYGKGSHSYWLNATDNNGCINLDTIQINTSQPIPFYGLAQDTSICVGDSLMLSSVNNFTNYIWSNGSNSSEIFIKQPGRYWVEAIDTNGCISSDSILLRSPVPMPDLNLGNDTAFCKGQTMELSPGTSAFTYLWQDSSTTSSYSIKNPGLYWVQKSNKCGLLTDSIMVSELQLFFPNLITPNADGHNDQFEITGMQQEKGELSVFNIWGNMVYKSHSYNNNWNGKDLTNGIYYYDFTYPGCKAVNGWLEIVR